MIVDVHCHLGRSPNFHFPDVSIPTMLGMMDRLGIDRAYCCHLALLHGEWEFGFRESQEAYREAAGRLRFYTVYDPTSPRGIEFVRRCLDNEGFAGIKIHPSFHGCYADDDRYEPIWQFADRDGYPLLAHSWDMSPHNPAQKYSFPRRYKRFVAAYPRVKLILGHAGGRHGGHVAAADLARRHANVFVDTSGDCYTLGLIEYLVDQAGSDKVLFGSDLTWIDPRTQLGMILNANISSEAKHRILHANAGRVFRLAGTPAAREP
jgi:hypothetical protein